MTTKARHNVNVSGQGKATLLFVHGFGFDQHMWRLLAPHFANRFRVVLMDLAGSGNSDPSAYDFNKYASLEGHADDVLAVAAEFARGPTFMVGHSVSSMIGMLASLKQPERFVAQVMVGPSPCYINDGGYAGGFSRADIDDLLSSMESNYLGWSSTMAPAIMGASGQPELAVELTNNFYRTDPTIAAHFARVTFLSDHREELKKLHVPTLVLQCSDDLIAPVSVGQYMHRKIPRSSLKIIDNVGHCPQLSSPDASTVAIREFLQTLAY